MTAARVCNVPGCPTLTRTGRCADHQRQADLARGSATERGYSTAAWRRASTACLQRDPTCTLCHTAPSTVADHYPHSRRELLTAGVPDPDALHRLRGLCRPCHSRETATHQPGGWHTPGG